MREIKSNTEKLEQIKEEALKKENRFRSILTEVTSTEAGIEFLKILYERSGFNKPNLVLNENPFSVNKDAMVYNEGRKSVYLELRNFIPEENLIKIEIRKGNVNG